MSIKKVNIQTGGCGGSAPKYSSGKKLAPINFLVAKQLNTHICVCVCLSVCSQFCKVWYLPLDNYVRLCMTLYDYV